MTKEILLNMEGQDEDDLEAHAALIMTVGSWTSEEKVNWLLENHPDEKYKKKLQKAWNKFKSMENRRAFPGYINVRLTAHTP